jgi:uncharacterized protein YdhG (YjbR/CyaY superfamily)
MVEKDRAGPIREVDDYLAILPEKERAALEKLRRTIKSAAPRAVERLYYHMPAFYYQGWLVAYRATKTHCSLHLLSTSVIPRFKGEAKAFSTSAGTLQFTVERQLPAALVRKLVTARMRENEERKKAKTNGPKRRKR